MLEFDPAVFLAHCALFLGGVLLFDRFLFGPVYPLLERRRRRLNQEGAHAEEARRTLEGLKERYRREMEEIHREGARLLKEAKERAEEEAQRLLSHTRNEAAQRCDAAYAEAAAAERAMEEDLAVSYDGLIAAATERLWEEPRP